MASKKLTQREIETTREVKIGGIKTRVRKVEPSAQAIKGLGMRTHRDIIGHMAINPREIEKKYALEKAEILRSMALMSFGDRERFIEKGPIDFCDHKGLQKFFIVCTTCGDKVAYCWAKDEKLTDWCDLHYLCWYDVESWHGARAVNVSPIDGHLGFECSCGEDTRDARANRSMPPIQKRLMIDYSQKHRVFGSPDSKFITATI